MKKLLLSVVAIIVASTSFAQNTVVASLSHEGKPTMFYGVGALQQAVAAAESGDIISLSSGTFNATNITNPKSRNITINRFQVAGTSSVLSLS